MSPNDPAADRSVAAEPVAAPAFQDWAGGVDAGHRFTAFMDHVPFDAWVKDGDHRYLWANPAHLGRLDGIALRDLVGRTADEVGAPWRADDEGGAVDAAFRTGRSVVLDVEFTRGGVRRRLHGFVFAVAGPGSSVGGVFADVTDLDAARRAAEQAGQRFEAFMRHVPAAAYVKDADGRHVWANRTYLDHYDLTRLDDLVGKTTDDLDAPDLAAVNAREDRRTLDLGAPRLISTHGENGAAHAIGYRFPVRFDDEERLAGIWVDTTDLARTRSALARWRERDAAVFGNIPTPIAVSTVHGEVVDANPAFCALVERRLAELRGCRLGDLVVGDPRQPPLDDLVAGRASTARFTRKLRSSSGTLVTAAVTAVLVEDPEDGAERVVEMHRVDSTHRGDDGGVLLNEMEAAVLAHRAAGSPVAVIAEQLGLSKRGVDYYIRVLTRRLRCPTNNAAALVSRAYFLGVLDPGTWPPSVAAHHRAPGRQVRPSKRGDHARAHVDHSVRTRSTPGTLPR